MLIRVQSPNTAAAPNNWVVNMPVTQLHQHPQKIQAQTNERKLNRKKKTLHDHVIDPAYINNPLSMIPGRQRAGSLRAA
jgi:hypothetical protein